MDDKDLFMSLSGYAIKVRHYINDVRSSVNWLKEHLPMEKELKEVSRVMFDSNGEVFLYYDGVYYSWRVILSILRKQEVITVDSLYDSVIDKG